MIRPGRRGPANPLANIGRFVAQPRLQARLDDRFWALVLLDDLFRLWRRS